MPKTEIFVMLVVLVLSVFWNLVYAVGIGLVLASLIFMKKIGDVTAARSQLIPLASSDDWEEPWMDELAFPDNLHEEVYIKHLDGPIFFGNINEFQELAKAVPVTANHVIIRMDKVPYIDQSGLYALEEALYRFTKAGIKVIFVHLAQQPMVMMESIDIIPDLVPREMIFENFKDTMVYIRKNVKDVVG